MACNFYRDRDGFCHLTNRCWSGKPCPRTQAAADRARDALVDEIIARRDASEKAEATSEFQRSLT